MRTLASLPALLFTIGLSGIVACNGGDKGEETGSPGDDGGEGSGDDLVDADDDGFPEDEDCDDSNPEVFPGADELCNDIDDDCDEDVDEDAVDMGVFQADADGDGYVDSSDEVSACAAPSGYVEVSIGEDCDDADADVNPGAEEVCNGVDDDCDEEIDEDVLSTFWEDADGDGHAGELTSVEACEAPEDHYAEAGTDCDDADPDVNPDADEICGNGVDDNCDGLPGECSVEGDLGPSDAAFTLEGDGGARFIALFAEGGDINGDGVGDVVAGSPYNTSSTGQYSGEIHVALGPLSGAVTTSAADQLIEGEAGSDFAGWSLRVGDIDGDGFDDVATVSTGYGDSGRAYLQYGSVSGLPELADSVTWDGPDSSTQIGRGIAMGDVDGSGVANLMLVSQDTQTVYVFGGTMSGGQDLDDATGTIYAPDAANIFARGMDSGDLDGDGVDDVAMTAPWADSYGGLVFVTYGPITSEVSTDDGGARIEGNASSYSGFGYSDCSTNGDVNGDGYDDLLFGSYGDGGDLRGSVRLYLGPLSGTFDENDFHARYTAPNTSSYTGNDSEIIGDTDGDGFAEILFSSYNSSTSNHLVMMYGPVSGTAEAHTASDARFSTSGIYPYRGEAHVAGDLNGDGLDDIMWTDGQVDSTLGELYLMWGGGL